MKKETLKMYGTQVHVYKYEGTEILEEQSAEFVEGKLRVENLLLDIEEAIRVELMLNKGELSLPKVRTKGIKYAEGLVYNSDRTVKELVVVVGEQLDEKQMTNVLISLGVEHGLVSVTDIKGIINVESILVGKITAEVITDATLGEGGTITSGTITVDEEGNFEVVKEKPKKKTTRKKK